tara:strand:+ start:281 stop:520 length:240 start_codon:yes stop_codon:yes gene_type:complete
MRDMNLKNEQWIEMYSDLAMVLADLYGGGLETEVAPNGDRIFTEESQEKFINFAGDAEYCLERLGFMKEVEFNPNGEES